MPKTKPQVVVIGGGTGSFTLLTALKELPLELTALVNMADDGGSTGLLRDELGVLPPGDIRQCLVALSGASQELRDLFNFRFPPEGSLAGHSFGNLFLSAVEKMTDDFNDAVRIAGDVLQIRGRVLPMTLGNSQLVLQLAGKKVVGQHTIELTKLSPASPPQLSLAPASPINPAAAKAISDADLVIIAPGNLYASLAPALLVDGLAEALQRTPAALVFVCNLVNKPDHTANFAVHDYAREIERFIGEGLLDYVLYNIDQPSPGLLDKYALDGEYPVGVDPKPLIAANYSAIAGDFLSHSHRQQQADDTLIKRSLIRHDGQAVAASLLQLITPS